VFGVGEAYRHHHHEYFTPEANAHPRADYDEIWRDRGGRPTTDGFFELPAELSVRPMSQIPPQKRAMYRRRYALFEQVGTACKRFAGTTASWFLAQLGAAQGELAQMQDTLRLI
jgi:uncharacterized protein VirK/YbjX